MPDNSMYVEPVIAVNADMSGVQNPSMYKPVHIVNMPEAPTGGVTSVNGQTGDVTLTASDVGALPSSTVIPSKTSDLQNDSGYITASEVPAQVQSDWNEADNTDPAYIKNKPFIPAAQVNSDWNSSSGVSEILNKPNLATVATSGSYNDLSNKPSIPAAQVQSDYAQTDSTAVDYIKNKPALFSGNYNDLTNKPDLSVYAESSDLAPVATSGSYNDLSNKPTIPAAQVNSDWNASSGVAQILNKPSIPSATSDLQNDSGYITASDVPAAQEQANWNESDSSDPAYIKNKPSIPAAQVNSDWNASSGVAEILNKPTIPSGEDLVPAHSSSDSGKVLGVNSSGNTAWVNAGGGGGGSYTAGNAIDLTNDEISVKYDGQTITQDLVQGTPTDVSTVTATGDARLLVPSDILTMIKSSTDGEFVINIPANTFKFYGSSTPGAYSLTINLSNTTYGSYDRQYQGSVSVNMSTYPYLDAQTIRLKGGTNSWGGTYYYDTGYLQLVVDGRNVQTDSTTLTTPVQFAQMVSGNGPLKVSNPVPSYGTSGQYLKLNETGPVWANLPAQVNANWNATTGAGVILNKPTIPNTGNGTIDVSGEVISVKYDTDTLKQIDGANVDFSGDITNANGTVGLNSDWMHRFYGDSSGQGVAQIPGSTYSIYNVEANTKAYLAIFASSNGLYGGYMYYTSKPLSYTTSGYNNAYIDAQDVLFDFPANSTNGWAGTVPSMTPYYIGVIFTHNNGSSFNMPTKQNTGVFKLGLYAQGAGPLSVKIPVPAFDTTTDLGKVLQVTANGLAWVSLS